jgi:hypothetical protein
MHICTLLSHFLFEFFIFVYFFKGKFQSLQLQSVFLERNAEYMHHVFKLKNICLNKHDFIIYQIMVVMIFFFVIEQP